MAHDGLRFGIFLAPFRRVGDNPNLALHRDLELVQWLDHLGYDEAWIGEHHSAGWETIAAPEIFIGVAADRTKHIMLGSGVTSLPCHHPLMDRTGQAYDASGVRFGVPDLHDLPAGRHLPNLRHQGRENILDLLRGQHPLNDGTKVLFAEDVLKARNTHARQTPGV